MTQGAERLSRDAHPPVTHRLVGRGEVSRELTNNQGLNTTQWRHCFGAKRGKRSTHFIQAINRQRRGPLQAFAKQGIEHATEQRRISTRTHEHMLVSHRCGFTAPRIDDHHFAAAGLDRLETLLNIWHGHDAAVGSQGVGAQNQHEIGVVDVRNR
ncbi:hypothetical protein D3C84_859990 [compost metagenome]